jgi:hypothetical protein
VPIILALGLGVVKISGKSSNASGLGLVTLASAIPVASVLFLAAMLGPKVPAPCEASDFFSADPGQRSKAVYVAGNSAELYQIALRAVYSGDLSTEDFAVCFPERQLGEAHDDDEMPLFAPQAFLKYAKSALLAVLPLALVLIIAIGLIARDRIFNADIVVLGILFASLGMFALNLGMTGGITVLSSQAGNSLKQTYTTTLNENKTVTVRGVDNNSLITVPGENGPETFIWVLWKNKPTLEKFVPQRLNGDTYTHIPIRDAMSSKFGVTGAYILILIIVFFLGFFAIFAEPGLAVTAVTVEEMTTGTFKRSKLIMIAAMGVGGGMVIGFARVLFSNILPVGGIHLSWLLAPCYAIALILTIFAPEDFSSIAWDVAGIATGPITVPIIITTGLGLGNDSLRADGAFGIVATASVFPIIVILISGIIEKARSKRVLKLM